MRYCFVVLLGGMVGTGCQGPADPSLPATKATAALTSTGAPATPYAVYNPGATVTPTAPATGTQDPMPASLTPPPASTHGGAPPPLPVDDAQLALQRKYVEALTTRWVEWRRAGLSDEEIVRRQDELKRSMLGD